MLSLFYQYSLGIPFIKLDHNHTFNSSIFSERVRDIILSNKMVVHGPFEDDDIASNNKIEVSDTVFVSTRQLEI